MAEGQPSCRCHVATGLAIIATAAGYFLAGQTGVLQQLGASGQARLVWPASGVALAAVLIFGVRVWPGIALGSVLTSAVLVGRSLLAAFGVAIAVTAGTLLASMLLRRAGFRSDLVRVRDALALVCCGAVAGAAVGTALRIGVLTLAGIEPARAYGSLVLLGWFGSALGVVVVTPFLLVVRRISMRRMLLDVRRLVEAVGLFLVTLAVTWWVIGGGGGGQALFLVFPLLIWAAWRFQLAGAAPCVVAVSIVTVYATVEDLGPLHEADPRSALLTAQAFVAATALVTLFLAVAVTERNAARDEIDQASHELAKAVYTLDERLRPREILSLEPATEARPDLGSAVWTTHHGDSTDPREIRTEQTRHPRDG